jgi:WD40 repeat protein
MPFPNLILHDLFISYSRQDGKSYAAKLKEQLAGMDYRCFIDFEQVYAGDHLSRRLQQAIKRSRTFVLVGTPRARISQYVRLEMDEFLKTGRTLIPIDVQDALVNPSWDFLTQNQLVWIDEPNIETPSPETITEIKRLFVFRRRNVIFRSAATALAFVLLLLSAVAGWQAYRAKQQQALAEERKLNAQSGELASLARARLYDDPELGLLLAIEAVNRKPTPQAELTLKQLLAEAHLKTSLRADTPWLSNSAVSQDGQWIVATGSYKDIQLWHTPSGKSIQPDISLDSLMAAENLFHLVARFGPDDTLLVTNGQVVKKLRLEASGPGANETGEEIKLPAQKEKITGFAYSPDGTLIATTGENGTIYINDAGTGRSLSQFKGHRGEVFRSEFSPDGKYLVTSGKDQTARVWEIAKAQAIGVLKVEVNASTSIAVSPEARAVAIGYKSPQLWHRNDRAWESKPETLNGHDDWVRSMSFSSGGRYLVTASIDRTARVWDVDNASQLTVLRGHASTVTSAAFRPATDGTIVTTSEDSILRVWDAATGIRGEILRNGLYGTDPVRVSPNVELAVVLKSGGAELLEIASQRRIAELTGHEGELSDAVFSPDGKLLVTIGQKPVAIVREASSGRSLFKLEGLAEGKYKIYFSPDSRYIVAAGDRHPVMRVWESGTGKLSYTLDGSYNRPAFSPDGRLIITEDKDRRIREVREVATNRKLGEIPEFYSNAAAFSLDSKHLVTIDKPMRIRDTDALNNVRVVDNLPVLASDVSFSPDGKLIAVIGKHIRVYELQTGRLVSALGENREFTLSYRKAIFTSDNKYLITSGSYIRLWEIESGILLATFDFDSRSLADASFNTDSKKLTLKGEDGAIAVFGCELCGSVRELLDVARKRVTRSLTEAERRQYLFET